MIYRQSWIKNKSSGKTNQLCLSMSNRNIKASLKQTCFASSVQLTTQYDKITNSTFCVFTSVHLAANHCFRTRDFCSSTSNALLPPKSKSYPQHSPSNSLAKVNTLDSFLLAPVNKACYIRSSILRTLICDFAQGTVMQNYRKRRSSAYYKRLLASTSPWTYWLKSATSNHEMPLSQQSHGQLLQYHRQRLPKPIHCSHSCGTPNIWINRACLDTLFHFMKVGMRSCSGKHKHVWEKQLEFASPLFNHRSTWKPMSQP